MLNQSRYNADEVKALDDREIDRKYGEYFDNGPKDVLTYTVLAQEIISRLQNVRSFITGAFGVVRFPLYNARKGFQQVDAAQDSISDNATKVLDSVSFGAKGLIALAVFIGVVILVVKFKK